MIREKPGTEHSFVRIRTAEKGAISIIEFIDAPPGVYSLQLESFDSADERLPVVQTDSIIVTITQTWFNEITRQDFNSLKKELCFVKVRTDAFGEEKIVKKDCF